MAYSSPSRGLWDNTSRGRFAASSPPQIRTMVTFFLVGGVLLFFLTNMSFLTRSSRIEAGGMEALGGAPGTAAISRHSDATLVIYVYNAADAEEARNFAYFLRYGVAEDGVTYRIIITTGTNVVDFPRLPPLPPNAQYIHTEACTGTWGAIGAAMESLSPSDHEYIVVVDSTVRGPFLPPYVASQPDPMHWTEAFTNRVRGTVKLVGSTISCEGAPKEGDAAATWRGNPAVSPHVWATDTTGWELLRAQEEVFKCHADLWDRKYHSDVGASLAMMRAGWGIDCLMTRYQGVEWTAAATWQCNQRVRPDYEHHYDGISITPYETIFVPVNEASAAAKWSFTEAAERYERWSDRLLRPEESRPGVATNSWITSHWTAKSEKMVAMNTRGPGCFEFQYYLQNNVDLEAFESDDLALWEHFVILGQFQGRKHRFSCPMPVGNSFRVAYVLARGPRCFDHRYYLEQHKDLQRAGITAASDLFLHFAEFGQFERRRIRFTCADTMVGMPAGFDTAAETGSEDGEEEAAREGAANERGELLSTEGDAEDALQQALKGVLVAETAKDFAQKSDRRGVGV